MTVDQKQTLLKFNKYILCLFVLPAILGCSRTKDTFTSRIYHRMVSAYNPLFNGEQALLRGEATLEAQHKDNFEEILPVFRTGDKSMVSAIKPDMDKAVEKATKVIQQHSMMIRNEQKNKKIDDSYLLIGKARFYRREYLEALETFNYVVQQFNDKKITEEARLWAARTETRLDNYLSAKEKFENIYRSEELPKKLKPAAFAAYAQLEINHKSYSVAYQLLEQAAGKTRDKKQETRWLFIMGQLQSELGNDFEASELFKEVIKKGPPYELLFQAQLNRARNYDVDLQDPEVVFDDLRDMLRDDKNYDNRDQIYYVMAEVAEKIGEEELMIEYLKESVRVSTTNSNQKGLSYLKIAETKFKDKQYPVAAAYYDSAATHISSEHSRFAEAQTKKESLAGLVKNLEIIATQDSLLKLADMGKQQRLDKIDEIIRRQKEEEEARRRDEENSQLNASNQPSFAQQAQGAIQGGTWYFYNTNLRATGERDFMNTFGNRKLEDNWRRKDKQIDNIFDESGEQEGVAEVEGEYEEWEGETEEQLREKYLAEIPLSPEAQTSSHQKIIGAFMAIGTIYKEQLKDLNAAEENMKELLQRYSDLEDRPRVLYTLYRINVLAEDHTDAQYYKEQIIREYPDTEYAYLLQNDQPKEQKADATVKAFYKKTFTTYNEGIYDSSLILADSGLTAFGNSEHGPKFMLIKAFSLGKLGQQPRMKEALNAVVTRYPGTDQSTEAQNILNRMNEAKNTGNDTGATEAANAKPAGRYSKKPNEEHKVIVEVPNKKGVVNSTTIGLSDFNRKFFKNLPLNTKAVYISAEKQMIMVSGLPNETKALQYLEILEQENVLKNNVGEEAVRHFVISNSNFTNFYKDKDFEGYLKFFGENYKTE